MTGGIHGQSSYSQILIEPGSPTYTFDDSSHRIEVLSCTISKNRRMVGGRGNWGTLSRPSERTREGAYPVFGEIKMYVSPDDIDMLADDVFGMTESPSGTFSLNDNALPYFGILADMDDQGSTVGPIHWPDCVLNYWELSARAYRMGEQGEPDAFIMTLGIIGSDEIGPGDGGAIAWPTLSPVLKVSTAADEPYVFSDSAITLFGTARSMQSLKLRQDNFLYAKYTNSLTPHSIRSRRRLIRLAGQLPWNADNDDLHNKTVAGAAATVVLTNGNMSTSFAMANLETEGPQAPLIRGNEEIGWFVQGTAGSSGDVATATNRELQIVNDNTP